MGSDSVLVAIISENFREICRIVSAGAVLTHLNDTQTHRHRHTHTHTHTHPDRGSFLFLGKNPILWNGIKKEVKRDEKASIATSAENKCFCSFEVTCTSTVFA